jgi:hypothetical protein
MQRVVSSEKYTTTEDLYIRGWIIRSSRLKLRNTGAGHGLCQSYAVGAAAAGNTAGMLALS